MTALASWRRRSNDASARPCFAALPGGSIGQRPFSDLLGEPEPHRSPSQESDRWKVGEPHAEFPKSALLHELDLAFFEDRFLTASTAEQELLLRMATRSGDRLTSADLRVATRDIPNIRELLRRLVGRGLLYRPTRGTYRFALPLFGTYLRRHRKVTNVTRSVTLEAEAHLGTAL